MRKYGVRLTIGLGITAAIATVSAALLAQSTSGAGSWTLPYSGQLKEGGAPVDGQRYLIFCLYNSAVAGAPCVWSESRLVEIRQGRFSVMLGVDNPLDELLPGAASLYVGVAVDAVDASGTPLGNPIELQGRQLIGSSGFAWRGVPGRYFHADVAVVIGGSSQSPPYADFHNDRAAGSDARLTLATDDILRLEGAVLEVPQGVRFPNGTQIGVPRISCGCFGGGSQSTGCGHMDVSASLPGGYQLTGGGCSEFPSASVGERQLVYSFPSGTSWNCRSSDEDNCRGGTLTAYVCGCQVAP